MAGETTEVVSVNQTETKSVDCSNLLLDGLSRLFNDETTSDVTLVVGNTRYHAHKAILAASSEYFHRMFYGGTWKESALEEVILKESCTCESVFITFLEYFYTGVVSLCPKSVHHLLTLADKYAVKLKDYCLEFMAETIDKGNIKSALSWMPICYQLEAVDILERCYDIICFNLEKASEMSGWLTLPLQDVLVILKRADIIVPSEYTIYIAVQSWVLSQKDYNKDMIEELLSFVEFRNMTATELLQVEQSVLATEKAPDSLRQQLYEAFRYLALTEESLRETVLCEAPRCYINDKKLRIVRFNCEASASISPKCHYGVYGKHVFLLNNIADCYTWTLQYQKETDEVNLNISVPRVSRKLEPDEQRNPYLDTDEEELYNDIPGTVLVTVLVLLQNSQGIICHIGKISTETEMPMVNGGEVVQFSLSSWRKGFQYLPNECLYSFEIAKLK